MKIARIRLAGEPRLAVIVGDTAHPIDATMSAAVGHDLAQAAGDSQVLAALRRAAGASRPGLDLTEAPLLSPLVRPGKIVAVGRNYPEHAAQEGAPVPSEPLVFAKFSSAIVGPGEAITWDPRLTSAVDFEAELAVVIGRTARRVSRASAIHYSLGYTCLNDVSARDIQFGDGQWVRGKSLDTFCPLGPWVVTADEVPDPQRLAISCTVSGERLQDASTADMYFGVAELVHRLSFSFTLEPGDIIATGTPEGVGYFRDPRRSLRDGDTVVVSIESVGTLSNPVVVR